MHVNGMSMKGYACGKQKTADGNLPSAASHPLLFCPDHPDKPYRCRMYGVEELVLVRQLNTLFFHRSILQKRIDQGVAALPTGQIYFIIFRIPEIYFIIFRIPEEAGMCITDGSSPDPLQDRGIGRGQVFRSHHPLPL
jgi:hypothetical protein